jgi:S1-C subfamily serine protease
MGPYTFPGAKLLSYPDPGSPLRQIGLRPGDIITRLDGVRVTSYAELDRHYANTSVRYVRYPATVRIGTIFIDADLITP